MGIEHTSRIGKVYHLHVKTGKSGKPNYYFSTDPEGLAADTIPAGYEIYENVPGQVFLRRIPKKLIADDEFALVKAGLGAHAEDWHYKTEIKKNMLIVYETDAKRDWLRELAPWINPAKEKTFRIQNSYYQAVFRFILVDPARRLFTPERYCFRGSVDGWINLGPPASLPALIKKYVKHLGRDSFYELY